MLIWRRWPLLAVAAGLPMLEAAVVVALAPRTGAVGFAPQVSAIPPFAAFHDLRWLAIAPTRWWTLALALPAVFIARATLVTALTWAAWPVDRDRPQLARLWARAASATAVVFAVIAIPTLLVVASVVVSLSWLVLAGVGTLFVVALVSHHLPVADRWWVRLPSWRSLRWMAATFGLLTVGAAAVTAAPGWMAVPLAGLVGLFNAWAWRGVVGSLAGVAAPGARPVPWGAIALVAALVAMVLGTWGAFSLVARSEEPGFARSSATADPSGIPVIDVRGFSSSYDGVHHLDLGPQFAVQQFSYRGLSAGGRPLPYDSDETHQSVTTSVTKLRRQVDALHEATGRPVSIIATSEGSVVARVLVAMTPPPSVSDLLMLSPLLWPARVEYPPPGQQGPGVPSGYGLRAIGWLVSHLAPYDIDPDLPFVRSLLDHRAAIEFGMMCPQPGVRERALVPVTAGVAGALPESAGVPITVVGGFHAGAVAPDELRARLSTLLTGDRSEDDGWAFASALISKGASAWLPPRVPLEPAQDGSRCADAERALTAWASEAAGHHGP